jgi:hypothetical protein
MSIAGACFENGAKIGIASIGEMRQDNVLCQ